MMTNTTFEKKLEKLNLRVTESERDHFERARIKAGFSSVSSWARAALFDAAETVCQMRDMPRRDIGVCFASDRIYFGTDDLSEEQFDIPLPKNAIREGHITDLTACKAALKEGFTHLRNQFNLSNASVLVTSRLMPSTARFIKDLIVETSEIQSVFLIEYCMANAVGIDMNVKDLEPHVVVAIERDWVEIAEVCGAGLRNQKSFSWNSSSQTRKILSDTISQILKSWQLPMEEASSRKIAICDVSNSDYLDLNIGENVHVHTEYRAITGVRKALTLAKHLM